MMDYTWLPYDGMFMDPFGFGFYSPWYLYGGGFIYPGYGFGGAWTSIEHDISIGGYAIVAVIVIAVGAFIIYRLREIRREAAGDRESTDTPVV